jgi:tetratricopeptide (TPR) repeat protein
VSRATSSRHYRRAIAALEGGDWPEAEGWLLQARAELGAADLAVADALAYALLMQGDYRGCALALEPVLEHPGRSFWIWHKQGDALRGLHQLPAAAAAYRRALAEGSTSPITARNLLQVLHELGPEQVLAELERWPQPLATALLEGVQQAAALTAGLELAAWLQRQGLATPALERRLTEQVLYGLRWPDWLGQETEGGSPWVIALQARVQQLGLA